MLKNPLPDLKNYEFKEVSFKQLMQKRIYNVLIICSNYDYYLLEEDGRIDEQIFMEYASLSLRYPPDILHANDMGEALEMLNENAIDLVISWLAVSEDTVEMSDQLKSKFPKIPFVALSNYPSELQKIITKKKSQSIDYVFHWNGNVNIFLAIIKLVEDSMNASKDINVIGVKAILLIEDSIAFYSRYLPLIYKILFRQTQSFVQEGLNEHLKIISKRGRPKILLAKTFEEATHLFKTYRENLLGVISDVTYYKDGEKNKQAGFHFLKFVRKCKNFVPVIIQSSEEKNREQALELQAEFIYKLSETLGIELKNHITKYFSFGDFEFWDPLEQKVLERAQDLKQFQKKLTKVTIESIVFHAKRNDFSKWLQSRALFPLANLFVKIEYEDFTEDDHIREFLSDAVRAFRIYRSRGIIAKFDREQYDEYLIFSRIGDGSLGGKGRGLAFIDLFLKRHALTNKYKDITISIPRTVVLSTDVFDEFMETHNLHEFVAQHHEDQDILNQFISKELPDWAVKDIRAFLRTLKSPVAIRSSSVLEDSLYQPFAGVYATFMLPHTDINRLEEMVHTAIKSVFASSYYKNSKSYIKATSYAIEEIQMAVILQEVIGTEYDDLFFPNVSGVARSINFYPIGDEKPQEGIANIALGLGEIIVGGGRTLRFSPHHPKNILQLSSTKIALKETQKHFFGLDMNPETYHVSLNESINIKKINLRQAKNHKALRFVASTYDMHSNQIRSGVFHDGARILTFESVLKQDSFPLAQILKELLELGQKEIGHPIEMEFAVNLDVLQGKPRTFSFLQIRPIVENNDYKHIIPDDLDMKDVIIYSESALGNGKYEGLKDIVYVKPEAFDPAKTREIAQMIEEINHRFEKENKHYVLVGPGRWGSSDPWLGIPINWFQISAAKIIVESGLEHYRIDPSQGTHFFQNLTSFKVGYLTINPFMKDGFYDVEYLRTQETIYEDEYLKHVRFENDLLIMIEGKENKAVIFKENYKLTHAEDVNLDVS
jgi:hypothetical protein